MWFILLIPADLWGCDGTCCVEKHRRFFIGSFDSLAETGRRTIFLNWHCTVWLMQCSNFIRYFAPNFSTPGKCLISEIFLACNHLHSVRGSYAANSALLTKSSRKHFLILTSIFCFFDFNWWIIKICFTAPGHTVHFAAGKPRGSKGQRFFFLSNVPDRCFFCFFYYLIYSN